MSELDDEFTKAQQDARGVTKRPSNDDLKLLYGLFKQATAGDAAASGAKRPGRLEMVGRAKYDAWAAQAGVSADTAKQRYCDLVRRLLAA